MHIQPADSASLPLGVEAGLQTQHAGGLQAPAPRWTACQLLHLGDSDGAPPRPRTSTPWASPQEGKPRVHMGIVLGLQSLTAQQRTDPQLRFVS